MIVLGINAIFHDPAAALVVDGGSSPPPRRSASAGASTASARCPSPPGSCPSCRPRWCLAEAGPRHRPTSTPSPTPSTRRWRSPERRPPAWTTGGTTCARRTPDARRSFLATALPGLDPAVVRFVQHHVAHAASAGAGRAASRLRGAGARRPRRVGQPPRRPLPRRSARRARQPGAAALAGPDVRGAHRTPRVPRSSSDEYKVMALASYGQPRFARRRSASSRLRHGRRRFPDRADRLVGARASAAAPARSGPPEPRRPGRQRAARLEEVLLDLARWLHRADR